MNELSHHVGRQRLEVVVADEADALALRERVHEVNQRWLLPAIEGVLDELDVHERVIACGSIRLELGSVRAHELGPELGERIAKLLREQLGERLAGGARADADQVRRRTPGEARAELLEHFLVRGTVPAWASAQRFSFEQLLLALADEQPDALLELLRRVGQRRVVLERLAARLNLALLGRLVELLEPRHANLVLEYLLELELSHRREPIISLGSADFRQMLWVFTLAYLIREHGSQFNRKSFVKAMLVALADDCEVDYAELLESLCGSLELVEDRQPLRSLPSIIEALLGELGASRAVDERDVEPVATAQPGSLEAIRERLREVETHSLDTLARLLARMLGELEIEVGVLARALAIELGVERGLLALLPGRGVEVPREGFEALLLALAEHSPVETARALHGAGDARVVLGGIVRRLRVTALAELVCRFEPSHAQTILDYVAEVQSCQRDEPVVALSPPGFDRLLWRFTLAYLIRQPGSQFNRKRFVESLIADLADEFGLEFGALLGLLWQALVVLARVEPLRSLPAVVHELIVEHERRVDRGQVGLADVRALMDERELAELVATLVDDPRIAEALLEAIGACGLSAAEGAARRSAERLLLALLGSRASRSRIDPAQVLAQAKGCTRALAAHELASRLASVRTEFAARQPIHVEGLEALTWTAALIGVSAHASPQTSIYDRYERLRHYLRHGSWPWDAAIDDPEQELSASLAWLLALPGDRVRSVFPARPATLRVRAILRAFVGLDQPDRARLRELLELDEAGLLAELPAELARVWTEVTSATSRAHALDRAALERWTSASLDHGDAPRLLASLVDALRSGGQRWTARPAEQATLRVLLARHPEAAQEFLAWLKDVRPSWCRRLLGDALIADELVRALASPAHARLLELVIAASDGEAETDELRWRVLSGWIDSTREGPSLELLAARTIDERFPGGLVSEARAALVELLLTLARSESRSRDAVEQLRSAFARALAGLRDARASAGLRPHAQRGARRAAIEREQVELLFALLDQRLAGSTPDERDEANDERELDERLAAILDTLTRARPGQLVDRITSELSQRTKRERLAARLPESALVRIVELLEPQRARALLSIAELLVSAWAETRSAGIGSHALRRWLWSFVLEFLSETPARARTAEQLVHALFVRALIGQPSTPIERARAARERLWERARARAIQVGHAKLRALLRKQRASLLSGEPPSTTSERSRPPSNTARRSSARSPLGLGEPAMVEGESIMIANAGLVLASPFLPFWFKQLGLYTGSKQPLPLDDIAVASRAVHMLQWLVDGHSDAPEPTLVLAKLLCGLPLPTPISPTHEPSELDLEVSERLLRSMIQHWSAIGNSSIAGLRETFLQREGKLVATREGWRLRVQRKTVDVLVDRIPWAISIIAHEWMPAPIYVTW